jgi:GNAT superfamily N-acetyltransferase
VTTRRAHPLLDVQLRAVAGARPPVDGAVEFVPPLARDLRAVLAFTGHAYLATTQPPSEFADLALDGFGHALHPATLLRLAGPAGDVGAVDATLAGRGTGPLRPAPFVERTDLAQHPRVRHATRLRRDVRVYGDERGLVTLGHGLAGRLELSIEVDDAHQGRGVGAGLLADALTLVPAGEVVFVAVSPGNVRSLRLFLRAGFVPVASEVIVKLPG